MYISELDGAAVELAVGDGGRRDGGGERTSEGDFLFRALILASLGACTLSFLLHHLGCLTIRFKSPGIIFMGTL